MAAERQCPDVSPHSGKRCILPVGHPREHDDGERPSSLPDDWPVEDGWHEA